MIAGPSVPVVFSAQPVLVDWQLEHLDGHKNQAKDELLCLFLYLWRSEAKDLFLQLCFQLQKLNLLQLLFTPLIPF